MKLWISIWVFLFPCWALAEWAFLPESHHQQYLSYGLFLDDHSSLLFMSGHRAWGDLGGSIALLEKSDWASKPQLVLHAYVNAAYRITGGNDGIDGETIDDRVGLSFEFALRKDLRFLAGWYHVSGHANDGILDQDLIAPNVGDEFLPMRLIYDWEDRWRLGMTFKPIPGSEPRLNIFAADQFAEWFPWGTSADPRHGTPYLALGFEQYGMGNLVFTYHTQVGVYFGNHLKPEHHPTVRCVAGYYHGIDPRAKYAQVKLSRSQFGYAGLMIEF